MNPLRIAERLRTDYLQLLTTTFSPRQPALGEDFRRQIERDGFLTREPFVSLAQPYRTGTALVELATDTRLRFGAIPETPYQHQAAAVRRILAGQAAVIATGTGSGKTEAFLMPIVVRHWGIGFGMGMCVAVLVLCAFGCQLWAPETRNVRLSSIGEAEGDPYASRTVYALKTGAAT